MIIDSHAHVGTCRVFDLDQPSQTLIGSMDEGGIDASVVQPFPGDPDPDAAHERIAELAEQHPGRIYGLVSENPHQDEDTYRTKVRRYVEEMGFVGIKLHPLGHAVMPNSKDARLILTTAAELEVPVMIHTGPGFPFADPTAWVPAAKEFSDLTVILGHAGAAMFTGSAIVAAQTCDNIYLETSWCRPQDVKGAISKIGADRVLFGSDMAFNIPVALKSYEAMGFGPDSQTVTFDEAPRNVFNL